jgi:hypothetical protein
MLTHDLNVSPDDCPRCQQGCGPDSIDPRACREHLVMAAAAPVPTADEKWGSTARKAHEAGHQAVAEQRAHKATVDAKAIYANRAHAALAATPKHATIDATAIYAKRAIETAASREPIVAAPRRKSAIDADSIYAKRRADLRANQNRHQSPPASTASL